MSRIFKRTVQRGPELSHPSKSLDNTDDVFLPSIWEIGAASQGNKTEYTYDRGISHLTNAYMILSVTFCERLKLHIFWYYCCSISGLGTSDQIFILRHIPEKAKEFQVGIHYLFIDIKRSKSFVKNKRSAIPQAHPASPTRWRSHMKFKDNRWKTFAGSSYEEHYRLYFTIMTWPRRSVSSARHVVRMEPHLPPIEKHTTIIILGRPKTR